MDGRVEFTIGPVPSKIALAWTANARRLLAAVHEYRGPLSIVVQDGMVELCDSLLATWELAAAKSDMFEWSFAMSEEVVEGIIEQWLQIGALTPDELERLGVSWAPEWTRPMADALSAAVLAAIPNLSRASMRRFAERLERGVESGVVDPTEE